MVNGELIGSKAASGLLEIDRSTFAKWVKQGKIQPALRLEGTTGAMLFRKEDVEALAAERAA
jgi:predicted site-specific integrase-resolvase